MWERVRAWETQIEGQRKEKDNARVRARVCVCERESKRIVKDLEREDIEDVEWKKEQILRHKVNELSVHRIRDNVNVAYWKRTRNPQKERKKERETKKGRERERCKRTVEKRTRLLSGFMQPLRLRNKHRNAQKFFQPDINWNLANVTIGLMKKSSHPLYFESFVSSEKSLQDEHWFQEGSSRWSTVAHFSDSIKCG